MDSKTTISEQIRDALKSRPLTVREIRELTGLEDAPIRRVLTIVSKFGAVQVTRDPSSGLNRYGLTRL